MNESSQFDANPEKHAESVRKYPSLHLSDGEFVVADVRRHPIGIISIWFVDLFVVAIVILLSIFIAQRSDDLAAAGITVSPDLLLAAMALVTILVLLLGYVGAIIYQDNRFYVTNESVIQHIRTGLFTSREQTIALGGIEDASFQQAGFLQYILGYGSIRLSTVGDENTYRFTLVSNPSSQMQVLNDAVEYFKKHYEYESDTAGVPAPAPKPNDSKTTDQTS